MSEPRVNVTLRLSSDGLAKVDQLAEKEQRTRSQMLRLLIAKGLKYWNQP